MKFLILFIWVALFATTIATVNGKHAGETKSSMAAIKPTASPLMTSTIAPNKGPKEQVSPTKPMLVVTTTKKPAIEIAEKSSTLATPAIEKDMKIEALPLETPVTVETPQEAKELQPLAVTGFITRNGSIYEITDKNGMGKIEGRQASDDTTGEHVCNYGAVVIYSDVPCDKVTNVKVKEYEEKPALDQAPVPQQPAQDSKPVDNKETEDKENLNNNTKPAKKRPNKNRRNKNKNAQMRKQKKNKNRRNQNNQIRNGVNNNNRRRVQNQQQQQPQKRRKQQNQRRQQQQQQLQNRRKWQAVQNNAHDDDDDERQFQNQRRRNQRKGQKQQQAQRYTSDYEDY